MLKIFKKKGADQEKVITTLSKTASLLIHAAKIDENYTSKERLIIEKTLPLGFTELIYDLLTIYSSISTDLIFSSKSLSIKWKSG